MFLKGDTHNFGLQSRPEENKFVKFRDCWGEEVFLGRHSPVRNALNALSPYGPLLPGLQIDEVKDPRRAGIPSYELELFQVRPPLAEEWQQQSARIGASIALIFFTGLSDSHIENIVMGMHEGRLYVCSLDWETALDKLEYPDQSNLFRVVRSGCECGTSFCRVYGLRQLHPAVNPAAVIEGFELMAAALTTAQAQLNELLEQAIAKRAFARRYLIRDTNSYNKALRAQTWEGFHPEEALQLQRGDVPYFFHFYGDDRLRFWETPHQHAPVTTAQLMAIRPQTRLFGIDPALQRMGLASIAQTLDPETSKAECQTAKVRVRYEDRLIFIDSLRERTFTQRIL